ncbi:MAG TPA: hypothetical protein VFY30_12485 [Solirubrobacterales bacterium]|nr:hypothetical protein [Solirubrobacterales bacterium]
MKLPRFAPLTGIAFVVLLIIGFGPVGGDTPGSDDSASKISAFYHDNQTKEVVAAVIVALAVIFFAMFIVALRDYLRGDGANGDFWPTVALVGGVVSVAGFCLAITVHAALVDGGHNKLPGDAMIALNALDNWDFFAFAFPLTIMLFGVAGATLKGQADLPKWLGWLALVIGILFFAGPLGFIAFLLTGIWIIIASVVMYRRAGAATA